MKKHILFLLSPIFALAINVIAMEKGKEKEREFDSEHLHLKARLDSNGKTINSKIEIKIINWLDLPDEMLYEVFRQLLPNPKDELLKAADDLENAIQFYLSAKCLKEMFRNDLIKYIKKHLVEFKSTGESNNKCNLLATAIHERKFVTACLLMEAGFKLPGTKLSIFNVQIFAAWAITNGHMNIVEQIIEFLKDCYQDCSSEVYQIANLKDKKSMKTLLHLAAENSNEVCTEWLLKQGFDINASDCLGQGPLFYGAKRGHLGIVKLLVDYRAKINVNDTSWFTLTPLMCAAISGNVEVVNFLIKNGAEVNPKNKWGLTPLLCSVLAANGSESHNDVINILQLKMLINEADDTEINKREILRFAIANKWTNSIKAIFENDIANSVKDAAICLTALRESYDQKDALIQAVSCFKSKVNYEDPLYKNLLSCTLADSIRYSNLECIQLLIDCQANLNCQFTQGSFPLSIAVTAVKDLTKKRKIIKLLIRNGANINQSNGDSNMSLLQIAVTSSAEATIINLLLRNGADIYHVDNQNRTVFDMHCPNNEIKALLDKARKKRGRK